MILLVEGDWRALMGDPAATAARRDPGTRLSYRGLPVWVVSPGPSRMLTGEQVKAEGLQRLAAFRTAEDASEAVGAVCGE